MVQIVGHHGGEGAQSGPIAYGIELPSIAPGAVGTASATIPGAKLLDGVIIAPHRQLPAGLMWSALVTATNTVQIRVFNGTGAAIAFGWTEWNIWLVR